MEAQLKGAVLIALVVVPQWRCPILKPLSAKLPPKSETAPIQDGRMVRFYNLVTSAGLQSGKKGDPLPLAYLGGSQHLPSESSFKYCNYLSLRNITPLHQSSRS